MKSRKGRKLRSCKLVSATKISTKKMTRKAGAREGILPLIISIKLFSTRSILKKSNRITQVEQRICSAGRKKTTGSSQATSNPSKRKGNWGPKPKSNSFRRANKRILVIFQTQYRRLKMTIIESKPWNRLRRCFVSALRPYLRTWSPETKITLRRQWVICRYSTLFSIETNESSIYACLKWAESSCETHQPSYTKQAKSTSTFT